MSKRRSIKPRVFGLLDGLLLTETHKEVARDNKVIGFVRMRPQQFLALTTLEPAHVDEIRREAKPLEQYNAWSRAGETLNSPFLRIDRVTGQVCGHEGRHRAAALEKAEPGELMDVAITLRDKGCSTSRYYEDRVKPGKPFYEREKRYLGKKDVPTRFCNEFDASLCERIDLSSWHGLYDDKTTHWAESLDGAVLPRSRARLPLTKRGRAFEAACAKKGGQATHTLRRGVVVHSCTIKRSK